MNSQTLRLFAACAIVIAALFAADVAATETPLGAVSCAVPAASQATFIDRLRKFATHHGFAIEVSTTTSGQTNLQLWRQELLVVGGNAAAPESFQFQLFSGDPAMPPADSLIARTVHELRFAVADLVSCEG